MKLISTHPDDPNQKRLQAEKERVQERRRLELRNDLYHSANFAWAAYPANPAQAIPPSVKATLFQLVAGRVSGASTSFDGI